MPDIFISYSSHDRLQALSLAEKLRSCGYDPWIDQHHIHGANRWGKEIVQAIDGSQLVAVLISSASLLSDNVIKELNLAAQKHKHLLPIMIEETELTEEFAYHLTGLHQVAIENTDSIVKALEQLKIRTSQSDTSIRPYAQTPTSKDIRLAILPFDDLSKEHDNEWFADGMLDELITTLGALEHLKVPSRTDVMYYKKHHPKAQEIASDLNVRYLVGGSVRKSGNKIRITASLTDAFTNGQLWTNQYDGNFDDIFELQERVSKEITATLKLRLTPEDKKKIEEQPTENAEAYELWRKGLVFQRHLTRQGYENALKLYQSAVSVDPKFTEAYLGIANTCVAYYREYSRNSKWLAQAEDNLIKAESINGETSKTLWIEGEIAWQNGNFVKAENALKKAIKLDSKYVQLYNILGNVYMKTGRPSDAVEAFSEALKVEHNHLTYFNLLIALSSIGNKEKLYNEAVDAVPIVAKHVVRNPEDVFWRVSYAYVLHWANQPEGSLKEAEELFKRKDLDGSSLYNLGALFDELGQPDRNIELFRNSIKNGFRDIDAFREYSFSSGIEKHKQILIEIIYELEEIIKKENT
jgi:TolB-like protein